MTEYKNAVENLSKGVQIPTISHMDYSQTDFLKFEEFINYLKEVDPLNAPVFSETREESFLTR